MKVNGGGLFSRSAALLGEETMQRLAAAHVLVVGVGGVGSWCAEALVRTGLGHITLMDDDVVAESNINRQCPATSKTLGQPKVEAMRNRLLAINPDCDIAALKERYTSTVHLGLFPPPSLIVDAIDSVDCKVELILGATEAGIPLVSSMGAALRIDPTKVMVTRFEKVEGDGLARALRQRFKKLGRFPATKFSCVWSAETPVGRSVPDRRNPLETNDSFECDCGALRITRPTEGKVKGSIIQVTAVFGMCLASEAIRILTKGEKK